MIPETLSTVSDIREIFERDDEVDRVERDEQAGVIDNVEQVYDAEEVRAIECVRDKLGGLKEEDFKELDSPDHLVSMTSVVKEGGSTVTVFRATTVRVASHFGVKFSARPLTPLSLRTDRRRAHR
jgi:hypothetical protein